MATYGCFGPEYVRSCKTDLPSYIRCILFASMLAPEGEIEPCAYMHIFSASMLARNIIGGHFIREHARETYYIGILFASMLAKKMPSRVYQTPPKHNQASGEGRKTTASKLDSICMLDGCGEQARLSVHARWWMRASST